MKIVVLGVGIMGIITARHCLERGHQVTVVERQSDAALETSFANAAQISASDCEPWANRDAPLKALKWMFSQEAPLLFRPQLDPRQWLRGLKFPGQCNDAAFKRHVQQLVALGAYSHLALKEVMRATGIDYHRLERSIAHDYTNTKSFGTAGEAAALMRQYGVERQGVPTAGLLAIEPALTVFSSRIVRWRLHRQRRERGRACLHPGAGTPLCRARGRVLVQLQHPTVGAGW